MFVEIKVPGLKLPKGCSGYLLVPFNASLEDALNDSLNVTDCVPTNVTLQKELKEKTTKKTKKEKAIQQSRFSEPVSSTEAPTFTPEQYVELWNEYATRHKWVKIMKLGDEVRKKFLGARQELPTRDMWDTSLKGLAADDFFGKGLAGYKTKPMTVFFKDRYMDFYNAGLSLEENGVRDVGSIVSDWGSKLLGLDPFAAIHIPNLDLPLVLPEGGSTDDADKDT